MIIRQQQRMLQGVEMGFWIGLAIGLIIGANVGLLTRGLCVAAAEGDKNKRDVETLNDIRLDKEVDNV